MCTEFETLGHTDVNVPEIGTWQYGGGSDLLRKAVTLGAALINPAEYYGSLDVDRRAVGFIGDRVLVASNDSQWR